MEGFVLNSDNIEKVIAGVKRQLDNTVEFRVPGRYLLLQKYERVLSNRYRGKGRPRNSDYDYQEIDWSALADLL